MGFISPPSRGSEAMRIIILSTILISSPSWATTLISPSANCDLIIHELRASNDLSPRDRISKISELYKNLLIPSLTTSDLEGLLASPLEFRNWSNPTILGQVGEHLNTLRLEILSSLEPADRIKFLTETAPAFIRKEINRRKNSGKRWESERTVLEKSPVKDILKYKPASISELALLPFSTDLYIAKATPGVDVIDLNLGALRSPPFLEQPYRMNRILFSRDGTKLYGGTFSGSIYAWDLPSNHPHPLYLYSDRVTSLALSQNEKVIYSSSGNESLVALDIERKQPLWKNLKHRDYYASKLAVSKDGRILYSVTPNHDLLLWNTRNGKFIQSLKEHKSTPTFLIISKDGRFLYSVTNDRKILVWNLQTNKISQILEGHERAITSAALSSNGLRLYSASHDGTIKSWNPRTGRNLRTIQMPSIAKHLALSENTQILYSLSIDGYLRALDLARFELHSSFDEVKP
jgi:hypothetical protein